MVGGYDAPPESPMRVAGSHLAQISRMATSSCTMPTGSTYSDRPSANRMLPKRRSEPAGPSSASETSCDAMLARNDTVEIRTRASGSAWIDVTYGFEATCSMAVVVTEKPTTVAMSNARDVGVPLVLSSTTAGAEASEKTRFATLQPFRMRRICAFGPSKTSLGWAGSVTVESPVPASVVSARDRGHAGLRVSSRACDTNLPQHAPLRGPSQRRASIVAIVMRLGKTCRLQTGEGPGGEQAGSRRRPPKAESGATAVAVTMSAGQAITVFLSGALAALVANRLVRRSTRLSNPAVAGTPSVTKKQQGRVAHVIIQYCG